jgi:hypothetical protein
MIYYNDIYFIFIYEIIIFPKIFNTIYLFIAYFDKLNYIIFYNFFKKI